MLRVLNPVNRVTNQHTEIILNAMLLSRFRPPLPTTSMIFSQAAAQDNLWLAEDIIQKSNQPAGFLALSGDKKRLFSDNQDAFVMYGVKGRSWIALNDPIGPIATRPAMIDQFINTAHRAEAKPVFYQIDHHHRDLYRQRGFSLLKLGEEAHIRLADFTMAGKNFVRLRYNHGKSQRDGLRFDILQPAKIPAAMTELQAVSDAWLLEKKQREMGFSLGQFSSVMLEKMPCAVVRLDGKIIAFATLLQTLDKREILIDLMRFCPETPHGTMDFLFIETCLWARNNGYSLVNLGLAPLSGLEQNGDDCQPMAWDKIGRFFFSHGKSIYNFEGLREYKQKFRPHWHPKYLAAPKNVDAYLALIDASMLVSGGLRGLFRA